MFLSLATSVGDVCLLSLRFPLTLCGLQISHVCTGTPFFALLTRPVMGVSFSGAAPCCGIGGMGLFDGGPLGSLLAAAPPPPAPADEGDDAAEVDP